MPVLVHPWDMMGDERMKRWMLPWLVAMPAETQLSMLSLVLSGAFERLPESLTLVSRTAAGASSGCSGAWTTPGASATSCVPIARKLPSSYCDRFCVDSAIFDGPRCACSSTRWARARAARHRCAVSVGRSEAGRAGGDAYAGDAPTRTRSSPATRGGSSRSADRRSCSLRVVAQLRVVPRPSSLPSNATATSLCREPLAHHM